MRQPSETTKLEFLFTCVEGSNDAIMLTEKDGTIFYVNPAWEALYGYCSSEVIGRNPRLLRSGHHGKDFYRNLWHDVLDPAIGYWKGEIINRAKDGHEIPVLLTISPHRKEDGSLLGYMSVGVDLTDRKKSEAQLHLQDRLAMVGMLTSGLAHELGTPLGVIRGRAEYLLHHHALGHPEAESLHSIISQVDRISSLMDSLQNLSQQNPSGALNPVCLQTIVQNALALFTEKLRVRSISLKTEIPPESFVLAEAGRLQYVLLNILLNSIQAIDAERVKAPKRTFSIELTAKETKDAWQLEVRDTGCGIAPEHLPHVFKPFFTTKDVGTGTGLGLAIVLQIIQSWKGQIELESKLGMGTTILITLPKASQ